MCFQELSPLFQKSCTSERVFHQISISVERLRMAVSVFYVPGELKTPNLAFLKFIQLSTSYNLTGMWLRYHVTTFCSRQRRI